ncbi:MAG: PAS domain S-box protein [Arcticibacter sp.]
MENAEQYYRIFELSPVPTMILSGVYPRIFIKEVNKAYLALTGEVREQVADNLVFVPGNLTNSGYRIPYFSSQNSSFERVYTEKIAVKTQSEKFIPPAAIEPKAVCYEATDTPVLTGDGEVDFVIRTLQDVTAFVEALEREEEKESQFEEQRWLSQEAQKVAKIGRWEMDKNNRFTWSDVHYEIMEVEPGTEITVDFGVTLLKTQEDRDTFEELYKKAITTGEYFNVDLNILTPKGSERWIRYTGRGELKDGEFVRMYGIGQDITDQKRTELQLRYSQDQIETLIQTVDGIVFESDAQTLEFLFVSEQIEDLLGYSPEECVHQPGFIDRLLFPDDREEILKMSFQRIQTQTNYTGDYRVLRKDGSVVWMNVSISVIRENDTPRWLRGLMIDITAAKRISELEHVEKKVLELNASPFEDTVTLLKSYLQGLESIFPEMICAIMRVKRGHLYNWASVSLPPEYEKRIDQLPIADNMGSCGTAAYTNSKVIVSDIANDPRWAQHKDFALRSKLLSCWSQPITNVDGGVIATLAMYYKTVKSPTQEEIKVIDRTVHLLQVILQDRRNRELLEEANFLMRQSQELAHFGSVQFDLETRQLSWSRELYHIFGLPEDVEPTIDLYQNCLHPEDKDQVLANIKRFLRTKEDYVGEERIIHPELGVRYLKTWGRVRANEAGEFTKVIAAYMDITESKKIQEKLLMSEGRLRSLVDSQTNYVIRVDFNEQYTYANKKYIEDFGLESSETLGANAMSSILPSYRSQVEDICKKAIENPNEIYELEIEKYTKSGSIKHSFWHFICLTNLKGEPTEIQCIGIDISDRKKAEDERERKSLELLESERRYSDLFHLSPQPMWVYDPDTLHFLDVNNAAIQQYGYPRNQFLLMTMRDIKPLRRVPELDDINRKKQQAFFGGMVTHRLRSGELIQVDMKRSMIPFNGKMAHLVLAINITDRLEYMKALEVQNERLKEIAWIQLHVVRAPLARIMEHIEALESYESDQTDRSLLLKGILSSAHDLDAVIKDIVRKAEQI